MATNTKPLKQWTTDELKTSIQSGYFHDIQKSEAEGILREREREPDRKLARRSYNAAAWARAYSEGTFIVALVILWLVATGEPPGQAPTQPKAAEPETSLLAAPIAAPAPPTEAAKHETSPPAVPVIGTADREALPPKEASALPTEAAAESETSPSTAPTVAAPAEAPLPSAEAHPAGAAQSIASPEGPPSPTPTPNAASTEAQPTAPAADATATPRQRTSTRPRRPLSAPR